MNTVIFSDRLGQGSRHAAAPQRFFTGPVARAMGLALLLTALAFSAAAEKPERGGDHGKHEKHKQSEKHDKGGKGDKSDKGDKGNKGDKAEKGEKGGKQDQREKQGKRDAADRVRVGGHFGDAQRQAVRDYYQPRFKAGKCPPGLAKKDNGCLPPGQAKAWRMGSPLPADVTSYDVPKSVVQQMGLPPEGYKYVRVASDILLIAIGTGMVIDAIENLTGQ